MKNAIKYIISPFDYIAGLNALIPGLALNVIGGVYAFYLSVHFTGMLNMHFIRSRSFPYSQIVESLYVVGVLTIITLIISYIVRRKLPRLIDVFGTLLLARVPLLVTLVFFSLYNIDKETVYEFMSSYTDADTPKNDPLKLLIYFGLSATPFLVYSVWLSYKAFSLSINKKGGKAVLLFIVAFAISEIIVQTTFNYLFTKPLEDEVFFGLLH